MSNLAVPSTDIFKPDVLKGKVVFVTGGASGICYSQTLALMKHGCNAAIFGRRAELSKSSAESLTKGAANGTRCLGLSGDVRKIETIQAAVQQTVQEFGKIDFVIAGAAGNFLSPVDKSSANAFRTVIEIDLLGTFNTVKATSEQLKKNKGALIAVSATLQVGATLLQAHASAAKAGVDSLIRTLAIEFGPFGVRANTIAPGPIKGTEGVSRLLPGGAETKAVGIPLQRLGELDDIANATVFLFSPAASYITGAHLVVDGGEHYLKSQNSLISYPKDLVEGRDFRPPKAKL